MSERISPQTTWNDFKAAFCAALDETEKSKLVEAWTTGPNKTDFYYRTLMPAVATKLDLLMAPERHRCDYAFVNDGGVPVIFAEIENAHASAGHEIHCLCSLAAPLKVLVISCDWQNTEKGKYLHKWQEIIRSHHAVIDMDCLYAVIVGEWDEPEDARLQYSFTLLDTTGEEIDTDHHEVE